MTSPNDLYALPAEKHGPLSYLVSTEHTFIPEVGGWSPDIENVISDRVRIDVIKEAELDSRRIWRLSTVRLDGEPVMILQNAGREGDDHYSRLVTDADRYQRMIAHLLELVPSLPPPAMDVDGKVDDISDLTCFYKHNFDIATRALVNVRTQVEVM
jgi:hypothetical protein